MQPNTKKLTLIIVATVLVIAIIVGTVLILKSVRSDTTQTKTAPTQATADDLKTQAIDALKTNATDKAKTLFQEAHQQYKDLGDTNNVIDTEAQIYLIEHQYTPSP